MEQALQLIAEAARVAQPHWFEFAVGGVIGTFWILFATKMMFDPPEPDEDDGKRISGDW